MFILGNFVYSVAHLLEALITILYWLIIVRALISWVNPDPFNPIVQFLYKTTDPILAPIRKFMPILAAFFGMMIRVFHADHEPPHIHVQYVEF